MYRRCWKKFQLVQCQLVYAGHLVEKLQAPKQNVSEHTLKGLCMTNQALTASFGCSNLPSWSEFKNLRTVSQIFDLVLDCGVLMGWYMDGYLDMNRKI